MTASSGTMMANRPSPYRWTTRYSPRLDKIPHVDIDPSDGHVPGVPYRRAAGRSVGYGGQPSAGGRVSGRDVIEAIGVKVADLDIAPIDGGVPGRVQRV